LLNLMGKTRAREKKFALKKGFLNISELSIRQGGDVVRIATLIVLVLVTMLVFSGTAMAAWPTGSSGAEYNPVNTAMETAAAGVGLSPDTFIAIFNSAVAGDVSGYTDAQLAAECQVLSALSGYTAVLADYSTVYNRLGCSTRLASAGPTRGALPSTGIAIALLIGSGVVGIGAASQLLRKNR